MTIILYFLSLALLLLVTDPSDPEPSISIGIDGDDLSDGVDQIRVAYGQQPLDGDDLSDGVNQIRVAYGLQPLGYREMGAQAWADYLRTTNQVAHGTGPFGEIIAFTAAPLAAWIESNDHLNNILGGWNYMDTGQAGKYAVVRFA